MRRVLPFLFALFLVSPVHAQGSGASALTVAPTTLDLKAGEAGLFYITNDGDNLVTVQIEALDWKQDQGADALEPSDSFFVSPPLARIPAHTRQSVRVMAKPGDAKTEHAYRLRVSELPDPTDKESGVHVLLQFSVPVFIGHDAKAAPALVWNATRTAQGLALNARNQGGQTVKLVGLTVNGQQLGSDAFEYVLPGAARSFAPVTATGDTVHVSGRDARSGRPIAFDLAP